MNHIYFVKIMPLGFCVGCIDCLPGIYRMCSSGRFFLYKDRSEWHISHSYILETLHLPNYNGISLGDILAFHVGFSEKTPRQVTCM